MLDRAFTKSQLDKLVKNKAITPTFRLGATTGKQTAGFSRDPRFTEEVKKLERKYNFLHHG